MTLSEILLARQELRTGTAPGTQDRTSPERSALSRLRFHPALVVAIGASAALWHEAMHSGLSGDVFYQLASGRWMLSHHSVIRHDAFSYTVGGRPWLDEEWGFQVVLAWLVAHLGPVSYWLLSSGACTGAVLLGAARWRRTGAGWLWTATLSILAAAGLSVALTPRPQDLSYLFFSLLLLLMSAARRQSRWLFAIPPLLLVWANVHGSFLLGLGVLALELGWSTLPNWPGRAQLGQGLSKSATGVTFIASVVATMVNPHGPRLLAYALRVSTAPQLTSFIAEWQSPDFHSYFYLAIIVGPVLLLVALLAFTKTVFALDDLVLALLLLLGTLHAVRFTPYFVLAICAVLARWQPLPRESIRPAILTVPLSAVLAGALLVGPHVPAGAPQVGNGSLATPIAATKFLAHQRGRVFSTYWWDDYLISQGIPVFVDGRTDLYFGTGVLRTYISVSTLSVNPDRVLNRWGIRWVMWDTGDALSTYLAQDPRWRVKLHAGEAVVFERVGLKR